MTNPMNPNSRTIPDGDPTKIRSARKCGVSLHLYPSAPLDGHAGGHAPMGDDDPPDNEEPISVLAVGASVLLWIKIGRASCRERV